MRQNKGRSLLSTLILLLFLTGPSALGQEKKGLADYLKEIESRFDVRFSYDPQLIQGQEILPTSTDNLPAVIEYIKARTNLQVTQINQRYYSISVPNSIRVRVLEADTGLPLANASITIVEDNKAYSADQEGSVYIPRPTSAVTLEVKYLGYQSRKLTLSPNEYNTLEVQLQLSVDQLDEVFLQPVFTQGIYRINDGSFKFDTEKFGLLPGIAETDVLQISQTLPGVESIDETVSNLNIRGGTNDQNLILWDGIRLYQSGHFYGLISAVNPYITEEVSIYRNGTPGRYGESVSGVLALKAKDEVSGKINGKATLNLLHANAFIDLPLGKNISLLVAGRRSLNDLWQTPIYNSYSERVFQDTEITNLASPNAQSELQADEDFSFYDISTKLLYDPSENDQIRFSFLTINNRLRFDQRLSNEVFTLSETSQLDQQTIAGGINWTHKWSSKWSSEVATYRSQYNLDAQNFELFTTEFDSQGNEVIAFSGRLQVNHNPQKNLEIEAGYEFLETGVKNADQTSTPELRREIKDVLVGHHLYSQLSWNTFNGNTSINAGLRLTHYPKINKYRFEPRLNINQKITTGLAAEFHGELKSQSISQAVVFQNEFLGVENRRWIQSNGEDIPLVTSDQWSAGLVWNRRNWLINLEYFEKEVDGISSVTQGFQNQFADRMEIGSYKVNGLELIVNKRWKNLGAWLGYTYSDNRYYFAEFDPQRFPNNLDITHSFRAAISYDIGPFSGVFGLLWRSGKPFTSPLGEATSTIQTSPLIPFNQPNSERLETYFRADLSLKYLLIEKEKYSLIINAAFQNIFNSDNILDRYYLSQQLATDEFAINQVENRSLRFTPNFSVELNF